MKIVFGIDSAFVRKGENVPVVWDSKRVINAHMLLVGKSGTGKTFTLRKIINQLQKSSTTSKILTRIIDVHGDINIEGSSTVKFSESGIYGFNPLAINPDPDFGGVRKRIQSFISIINKTSRKLGTKQEPVLRNILLDLYAANGFYEKDPKSWIIMSPNGERLMHNGRPKKYPTLEDAYRYANFKHKAMFLGTSNKAVLSLEEVNKKAKQLYIKQKNTHKAFSQEDAEKIKGEIHAVGEQAIDAFSNYIKSIESGMELTDLIKYDSIETIKSVVDRLDSLVATGIFKNQEPVFDSNATIWRYDIRTLTNLDEKKLFVYFLLEDIFLKRIEQGEKDDVVEMVFLDEANLFFTEEADNIINIISKEARKFGLGLCCASQSPTHFSEDFMSSVGTKIILGLDQMFWTPSVQKLKIEQQALEWIVPHQKMVVQINNKAELKNRFIWTLLNNPQQENA
jgi:DNA helicase HerA-like ATPase